MDLLKPKMRTLNVTLKHKNKQIYMLQIIFKKIVTLLQILCYETNIKLI